MKLIRLLLLITIGFFVFNTKAQISTQQYIEMYKNIAISNMTNFHIPASITMAQGILESGSGNSDLAKNANNHFGIKCHLDWKGPTYHKDDDKKDECFRVYDNPAGSYKDHSSLLTTRSRYAHLFKLDITDYKGWAYGLKKSGYATDPNYPQRLIKIIEDNKLYELDKVKNHQVVAEKFIEADVAKVSSNSIHAIFLINGLRCTTVLPGDNAYSLAKEFGLATWEIYKYNDLTKRDVLKAGQTLFLQAKKRKGYPNYHFAKSGETMHSISQLYGIRLNILYKKNRMSRGEEPEVGQKIWLRKKKLNP